MELLDHDALEARRMLAESVGAFIERFPGAARLRAHRGDALGFDPAIWRAAADAGWLGLRQSAVLGGSELGVAELATVMEGLGRGLAPEPFAACLALPGAALARCPAGEVRDGLLRDMISGERRLALAWEEATPAARDASGAISGAWSDVHGGAGADGFLVVVDGALHHVPTARARYAPEALVDGGRAGGLTLDGAPAELLAEGFAAERLAEALDEARLAASAELIGVMDRALSITTTYLGQRRQFGVAIGSFQTIQHRVVDLWIQLRLSRAALGRAIAAFEAGPGARMSAVSAAKARCSDAALQIGRQSIQLHGGMGYTDECDIGLCLKRALVLSAFLGNAPHHRRRFADLALAQAS